MTQIPRLLCSVGIGILLVGCALSGGDANLQLERISLLSEFDKGLLDPRDMYSINANANANEDTDVKLRTREWVRIDISTTDDWVSLGPRGGNIITPVAHICSGKNKGDYLISRGVFDPFGVNINFPGAATKILVNGKDGARQYYSIFLAVAGYDLPMEGLGRRYFSGGRISADVCVRIRFTQIFGYTLSRELLIGGYEFREIGDESTLNHRKSGKSVSGF